jgi:hypothetical protein
MGGTGICPTFFLTATFFLLCEASSNPSGGAGWASPEVVRTTGAILDDFDGEVE